jgi:hypothetical protein
MADFSIIQKVLQDLNELGYVVRFRRATPEEKASLARRLRREVEEWPQELHLPVINGLAVKHRTDQLGGEVVMFTRMDYAIIWLKENFLNNINPINLRGWLQVDEIERRKKMILHLRRVRQHRRATG